MSTNSNVYAQGAGGVSYENAVQTGYFISFLLGLTIPGTADGKITHIRQQAGSLGYETDDLLLECATNEGMVRTLVQIKHKLTISEGGEEFGKVITAAWKDFKNTALFDQKKDRIFIVKSDLTLDEKNHLLVVLDWARAKATATDLKNEAGRIKQKQKYYQLIKAVIQKNNPDDAITEEQYFNFLRCLYVPELDYDVDNSQQKAIILSLIDNFKRADAPPAKQVWSTAANQLLDSNGKGGSYQWDNLADEWKSLFKVADFQQEVKQLSKFGERKLEELIANIKDTIGDYKLKRENLVTHVGNLLNDCRICVIAGDPGTGKSAVAKAVIENIKANCDGFILAFKADELNLQSLNAYFAQFGIQRTLKEVFSLFGLYEHNLIYIDAIEKLLEVDGLAATQLFYTLKDIPNVRLLMSCRKSDLGMIEFKYLGNKQYTKTTVEVLNDDELGNLFQDLPGLKPLGDNPRIRSLIRVPKYLDFAYRAVMQNGQQFENITEAAFKEKLWEVIVENKINGNRDGLPERRSRLLIDIAINRSRAMKPFASLTIDDAPAQEALVKENVVISSLSGKEYAPAHDVLEDWALVKYVDAHFRTNGTSNQFFPGLGQEPSMRRAYRLWVQAALQSEQSSNLDFIFRQLFNAKIDGYWRDESLIAVLYSSYCPVFFRQYHEELVKDNYQFLFRLVQVMRTACRENIGDLYTKKYLARGYGWGPVFELLYADLAKIDTAHYQLIYQLIGEWSLIIHEQEDLPAPTRTTGLILLQLLGTHISIDGYRNPGADAAVNLLCLLAGGVSEEITAIINGTGNAIIAIEEDETEEDDDDYLYADKLRPKIIKTALSGQPSSQLCKYLPELVMQLADEYWLQKTCKVVYPESEHQRMLFNMTRSSSRSMEQEEHYGLRGDQHLEYLPASSYQTPVLWLLRYHTHKALRFVIDVLNWCTANYVLSELGKQDEIATVRLMLNDGSVIEQTGSGALWELFRGKGVAPYVLQSVVMALEKYLLELCAEGMQNSDKVQSFLNTLYRESTSVATTAVIASVCQAYPAIAGDLVAPLYSDRHVIGYDVTRYSHDWQKHYAMGYGIHDQERIASDKLPHRQQHYGGLRGFVNLHSFNYGFGNVQIFGHFDRHRTEAAADDLLWLKWIDEMDVRTWRYTKEVKDGDKVGFLVEPTYQEGIQSFVDELRTEKEKKEVADSYSVWLYKVRKKEITAEPVFWRKIYAYYSELESYNIMDDRPAFLAEAGIRDLWNVLTLEEKGWCKTTIHDIIVQKVSSGYRPMEMDMRFSTMDYDAAIDIFPFLIEKTDEGKERNTFERLALYFLTGPFQENDPDANDFYQAFREDVWVTNEALAYKGFYGLIRFAKFEKEHGRKQHRPKTEGEEDAFWNEYETLLNDILTGTTVPDIEAIELAEYSIYNLVRAIKIIPDHTKKPAHFAFIKKLFNLYIRSKMHNKQRRIPEEDRIDTLKWAIEYKMCVLMFWNRTKESDDLLHHFLLSAHTIIKIIHDSDPTKTGDFIRFYYGIAEKFVTITDQNLLLDHPTTVNETVTAFTATWKKYDEILRSFNSQFMGSVILLDTDAGWRKDVNHWLPIDEQAEQFMSYIQTYGELHLKSVVTLLSHIGDQTLLLPMLGWLIDRLMKELNRPNIMTYKHIEQLIGRVYYNHLDPLLANHALLEKYLGLLESMVGQQSSDAYWVREFLIHLSVEKNL